MESHELYRAWDDQVLREYFWDIAGSFARGNQERQSAIYVDVWCKISWCDLHYDTANLMDQGFDIMYRYCRRMGWVRPEWYDESRHPPWPYRKALGRLRFFVKQRRELRESML